MSDKILSEATPEEMGNELNRRGLEYVLLVKEPAGFQAFTAPTIRADSNSEAGGIYYVVRDYLNYLEREGMTEWDDDRNREGKSGQSPE